MRDTLAAMKCFDGLRLKKSRETKGWSVLDLQLRLAKEGMRVSSQAIRYWEKDERVPSSNFLMAMSKILEREIDYFFSTRNEPPSVVKERDSWIYSAGEENEIREDEAEE